MRKHNNLRRLFEPTPIEVKHNNMIHLVTKSCKKLLRIDTIRYSTFRKVAK